MRIHSIQQIKDIIKCMGFKRRTEQERQTEIQTIRSLLAALEETKILEACSEEHNTMKLSVELMTTNNDTKLQFHASCASEGIAILDCEQREQSVVYLVSIDVVQGQRLCLPCRSVVEQPAEHNV